MANRSGDHSRLFTGKHLASGFESWRFGSVVWAKRLHQIAQAIHDSPQHSLAEASSLSINLLASSLFKEKKPVSISPG